MQAMYNCCFRISPSTYIYIYSKYSGYSPLQQILPDQGHYIYMLQDTFLKSVLQHLPLRRAESTQPSAFISSVDFTKITSSCPSSRAKSDLFLDSSAFFQSNNTCQTADEKDVTLWSEQFHISFFSERGCALGPHSSCPFTMDLIALKS